MNPSLFPSSPPTAVETGVQEGLIKARQTLRQRYQACEQQIRLTPTKAVLGAAVAGYCLHRLPVRAMLSAQVQVLAALIPPALFLFGAVKVCALLQPPRPQTSKALVDE